MSLLTLAPAARLRGALRPFGLILLGTAAALSANAQPWTPGENYFGRNNYIEFRPGTLPLILTAGHGGALEPNEIPDRNGSGDVTTTDRNTIQLAEAIANAIFARTGQRPHLVFSHLHRKKLDPNREIVEAARGNPFAEQAWHEFHGFIETARSLAEAQHGWGFVADMHGHGHPIHRLELGYNYGRTELAETDTTLNIPGYAWMGYFRSLMLHRPGVPFHTMLRGPGSLGDLINRNGSQKAWPSPEFPSPASGDEFFAGGYNSDRHTCLLDNALINGVQVECHYDGVRDSTANRNAFGVQFANALQPYFYNHYGFHLGTRSLFSPQPTSTSTLVRGGPPVTVTVTRTGWVSYAATIPLAFDGTAELGVDYTASVSSLSFSSGQTSRTVTITPAALGAANGDKTIIVRLDPPVTESANSTPLTFTLGDGISQTVRIHAPVESLPESAGAAAFRLERTQTTTPLTVPLNWSGSAQPEADYHDAPASVHFPAGVASVEFSVPLVDDGRAEPDKTLTAAIDAGASYVVGFPAVASIALIDDDRPAGLLAWLRGEIAHNVVYDSSGADRHGTSLPADSELTSGPTQLTLAGGVPAINFDGDNDTVALPRFVAEPHGGFTVAFFFRLTTKSTASSQSLLSYGTRGAAGSLHIHLNSTTALRTRLPGISSSTLDLTGTTWQNNTWRHYALTVTADGTCRVYLNGALQKTATGRAGTLAPNELFWLGWQPASRQSGGYMRGDLRDFRLYDRPLGATEITALAQGVQTFPAWLAQNALPADFAPNADPGFNGFPALVDYATAARPDATNAPPRYTVQIENDRLTLRFLRETAANDLTWTVEASTDLGTWQTLATRTAAASQWTITTAGAAATEQNGYVIVTDSGPPTTGRFLRLRVDR